MYSVTNILLEGDLHTRMVQRKLNPKLGLFTPVIREALEVALEKELPPCEGKVTPLKKDLPRAEGLCNSQSTLL